MANEVSHSPFRPARPRRAPQECRVHFLSAHTIILHLRAHRQPRRVRVNVRSSANVAGELAPRAAAMRRRGRAKTARALPAVYRVQQRRGLLEVGVSKPSVNQP